MPWTETTRPHYERRCPRYASDLTEAECALIEPLTPAPNRIGRPRKTDLREVVNALLYMASSGGAWRLLPKDFPPFSTVHKCFWRWRDEGLLRTINMNSSLHFAPELRRLPRRKLYPGRGLKVINHPTTHGIPVRPLMSRESASSPAMRNLQTQSKPRFC